MYNEIFAAGLKRGAERKDGILYDGFDLTVPFITMTMTPSQDPTKIQVYMKEFMVIQTMFPY
jgi:hypothetical protein